MAAKNIAEELRRAGAGIIRYLTYSPILGDLRKLGQPRQDHSYKAEEEGAVPQAPVRGTRNRSGPAIMIRLLGAIDAALSRRIKYWETIKFVFYWALFCASVDIVRTVIIQLCVGVAIVQMAIIQRRLIVFTLIGFGMGLPAVIFALWLEEKSYQFSSLSRQLGDAEPCIHCGMAKAEHYPVTERGHYFHDFVVCSSLHIDRCPDECNAPCFFCNKSRAEHPIYPESLKSHDDFRGIYAVASDRYEQILMGAMILLFLGCWVMIVFGLGIGLHVFLGHHRVFHNF